MRRSQSVWRTSRWKSKAKRIRSRSNRIRRLLSSTRDPEDLEKDLWISCFRTNKESTNIYYSVCSTWVRIECRALARTNPTIPLPSLSKRFFQFPSPSNEYVDVSSLHLLDSVKYYSNTTTTSPPVKYTIYTIRINDQSSIYLISLHPPSIPQYTIQKKLAVWDLLWFYFLDQVHPFDNYETDLGHS